MQEVSVGGWYSLTHLTIKDIAKYSGTSVSTVSRVLNNHPDVSEKARVQVMKVVEQYRYVPNNSARNLVIRESDTVAVVVRGIANPFFTRIIKTIERAIYAEGYSMSLHQIGSRDDELMTAAMLEREKRLRGIIFLGGRFNYSPADVAMLRVPFVCCTYANTFGSLEPERFSSVAIDDKREAYRAVRLLIERGHRRIAALIEAEDGDSISQLRYEGYCEALADAGIPFDPALVECAGSFEMKDAYRAAARLAEPGGNVDRERFFHEVLLPLSQGRPVSYRRYDCHTQLLGDAAVCPPKPLNLIEGAYSMHPLLADHYDL